VQIYGFYAKQGNFFGIICKYRVAHLSEVLYPSAVGRLACLTPPAASPLGRYVKPVVTAYKLRVHPALLAGSGFETLSVNQEEEWPEEQQPW